MRLFTKVFIISISIQQLALSESVPGTKSLDYPLYRMEKTIAGTNNQCNTNNVQKFNLSSTPVDIVNQCVQQICSPTYEYLRAAQDKKDNKKLTEQNTRIIDNFFNNVGFNDSFVKIQKKGLKSSKESLTKASQLVEDYRSGKVKATDADKDLFYRYALKNLSANYTSDPVDDLELAAADFFKDYEQYRNDNLLYMIPGATPEETLNLITQDGGLKAHLEEIEKKSQKVIGSLMKSTLFENAPQALVDVIENQNKKRKATQEEREYVLDLVEGLKINLFDQYLFMPPKGGERERIFSDLAKGDSFDVHFNYFGSKAQIQLNNYKTILDKNDDFTDKANQVMSSMMKTCKENIQSNYAALPTKEESQRFKNMDIKNAKKKLIKFVSKNFSDVTKKELEPKITTWFITQPPSQDEYLKELEDKIAKATAQSNDLTAKEREKIVANDKKKWKAKEQTFQFGIMPLMSEIASWDKTMTQTFEDICEKKYINNVTDYAKPASGSMYPSSYTIKNPKLGQSITYHELGHLLSGTLGIGLSSNFIGITSIKISKETEKKVKRTRKCLAEAYSPDFSSKVRSDFKPTQEVDLKDGRTSKYREFGTTEEDFADLISYLVRPSKISPACMFLSEQSIDTTNYTDIFYPLELPNGTFDEHSSNLFRALHEFKVKNNSLPASCHEYINLVARGTDIQDCSKYLLN